MVLEFDELVLEKDTVFEESIRVKKSITCKVERVNLTVKGDIDARNINAVDINAGYINAVDIDARNINAGDINARNINAGDINAWDINAWDINAWDINARNINAVDIICKSRKKKTTSAKTVYRVFITGKHELEQKEQMPEIKK